MLSKDELTSGIPFVLRLWDAASVPCHWIANLCGTFVAEWYQIYQQHNVETICFHAAAVFRSLLTDQELQALIGRVRCVVISTHYSTREQCVSDMP